MKRDSKRRWKVRILGKRDIPGYVTTLYPELLFWLADMGYHKQGSHYVNKEHPKIELKYEIAYTNCKEPAMCTFCGGIKCPYG